MTNAHEMEAALSISPRIMTSSGFDVLYREGMTLIEEVAAYLDDAGRQESRNLSRQASFLYATESMRLTTRLMQLASWLLLQRAVNTGEISREDARLEKEKVQLSVTPSERGGPGYDQLPATLCAFIDRGDRLFERVMRFDALDRGEIHLPDPGVTNSITDQVSRLKAAFGQD